MIPHDVLDHIASELQGHLHEQRPQEDIIMIQDEQLLQKGTLIKKLEKQVAQLHQREVNLELTVSRLSAALSAPHEGAAHTKPQEADEKDLENKNIYETLPVVHVVKGKHHKDG